MLSTIAILTVCLAPYEEVQPPICARGHHHLTASQALVHGDRSPLAPLCQRLRMSQEPLGRNEILSILVSEMTRQVFRRKQISSHVHFLKHFIPRSIQNRTGHTDLILTISTAAQLQPFLFHDAIYDLLPNGTLDIDDSKLHQVDDLSDLQLIIKSLNPTFRHAIKSIRLTYEPKRLSRVLQTLNSEQLPGLEVLYVRFCKGCTKEHNCTKRDKSFRHPQLAFPSLQAALGSHVRVEADPGDLQGFPGRKRSQ